MKLLRVLANSVLCAFFFAVLAALLAYDININLAFAAGPFARLALVLAAFYGPAIVLGVVVLFFVVQFFSGRRFAVKVVSPSFLALALPAITTVFLVVLLENRRYFDSLFGPGTAGRLRTQAIVLAALVVLGAAALYASRRVRRKGAPLGAYFALLGAGLAVCIGLRTGYPAPSRAARTGRLEARTVGRNVVLLGFEGLSLDIVLAMISEGRLPNFSWLVDNGSWGRLETLAPTESLLLGQSLVTGKRPAKHRQISASVYKTVLDGPALEVTPRYVLFRQMIRIGLLKVLPAAVRPGVTEIRQVLEANGVGTLAVLPPPADEPGEPDAQSEKVFAQAFKLEGPDRGRLLGVARRAFARDWGLESAAFAEKVRRAPGYFHLRLDGLNTVEAYFYKYSFPEQFGEIDPQEVNRYGSIIARYYEYYDQIVGKTLAALKENDLLVVYSPYGVEPLPMWKRFVEWVLGNPDVSAYHEDRPDGAVFFNGTGIAKRNTVEGMSLLDVAPTLLYYLGLPVGKDMDGIVRSAIFLGEFTAENPIFSISSYEEIEFRRPGE